MKKKEKVESLHSLTHHIQPIQPVNIIISYNCIDTYTYIHTHTHQVVTLSKSSFFLLIFCISNFLISINSCSLFYKINPHLNAKVLKIKFVEFMCS